MILKRDFFLSLSRRVGRPLSTYDALQNRILFGVTDRIHDDTGTINQEDAFHQ
jgi:hypothetical protein